MAMGKLEFRQMLNDERRFCGHCAMQPSGVACHAKALIRSPISPPPARKASGSAALVGGVASAGIRVDSSYASEVGYPCVGSLRHRAAAPVMAGRPPPRGDNAGVTTSFRSVP